MLNNFRLRFQRINETAIKKMCFYFPQKWVMQLKNVIARRPCHSGKRSQIGELHWPHVEQELLKGKASCQLSHLGSPSGLAQTALPGANTPPAPFPAAATCGQPAGAVGPGADLADRPVAAGATSPREGAGVSRSPVSVQESHPWAAQYPREVLRALDADPSLHGDHAG